MAQRGFRSMLFAAAAAVSFLASPAAFSAAVVGVVEYVEGEASLTRAGKTAMSLEIGEEIENFDLLKTGDDGRIIVALNKTTGMTGSLTVKPKTVFSVKTEYITGAPSTEADMLAGSLAVKAKKVAGTPSLRIRTTTTVMGVRGTEFEVVLSVNDSLLVGCSEGTVACTDDEGAELEAVPGQSVVRKEGEALARIPVAVSRLESFRDEWLAEELGVFRAAPLRVLDAYASRYRRMKADFDRAFAPLARNQALAEWASEYRRGIVPRSDDVSVMRQKSSIVPKLMAVRRVLFLFERVYYRLDEIRGYIGRDRFGSSLPSGGTVGEFFREMDRDRNELERRVAAYRFALRLYAERNDGRDAVSGEDEGDFFEDTESFFKD